MTRILLVITSLILLTSCSNNIDIVQLRAVDESLRNTNLEIQRENNRMCREIENKLRDPITKSKAEIWEPKMSFVKKLCDIMNQYIDTLQTQLEKESGLNHSTSEVNANKKAVSSLFDKHRKAVELSGKLTDYKEAIIAIIKPEEFSDNPALQKNLVAYSNELKTGILTDISTDQKKGGIAPFEDRIVEYFRNSSVSGARTMLNKIKNDVAIAANTILRYFDSQTTNIMSHSYERFSAIITQNSSYLRKGQLLQIYAGMGSFSDASKPTITINGTSVPTGDDAVSIYHLEITDKPGKYFIPVEIDFTSPDGSIHTLKRKIMYTVAE